VSRAARHDGASRRAPGSSASERAAAAASGVSGKVSARTATRVERAVGAAPGRAQLTAGVAARPRSRRDDVGDFESPTLRATMNVAARTQQGRLGAGGGERFQGKVGRLQPRVAPLRPCHQIDRHIAWHLARRRQVFGQVGRC
jgi:hypothetical protein